MSWKVEIFEYGGIKVFKCEQIKDLNDLELEVYNYIMRHQEKVLEMKIRELAEGSHVSTTTVLRFCKKMGCNGYSEFKVKYKMYLNEVPNQAKKEDIRVLVNFFYRADSEEFNKQLDEVASLIYYASKVIFLGIGSSGIVAKYGARYLTNSGKVAQYIDDPFYPVPAGFYDGAVIVVLSVSGETGQVMEQLRRFIRFNCAIVCLTNSETSTIAKMSDVCLTYYMPIDRVQYGDLTTQVPVIFILERIGKKVQHLLEDIEVV